MSERVSLKYGSFKSFVPVEQYHIKIKSQEAFLLLSPVNPIIHCKNVDILYSKTDMGQGIWKPLLEYSKGSIWCQIYSVWTCEPCHTPQGSVCACVCYTLTVMVRGGFVSPGRIYWLFPAQSTECGRAGGSIILIYGPLGPFPDLWCLLNPAVALVAFKCDRFIPWCCPHSCAKKEKVANLLLSCTEEL